MPPAQDSDSPPSGRPVGWFATTRWTLVLTAGEATSPESSAALEQLCQLYWYPLFAFARRRGYSASDAQDLTQEFFARLVAKDFLRHVAREKGRFRSFLLAAMKNLMANEFDRERTLKRGGAQTFVSIDLVAAEDRFAQETPSALAPEALFDREWALRVLDQALAKLESEFTGTLRQRQFDRLKPYLSAEANAAGCEAVAADLGMTGHAVAMAVSRLRARYRSLVRAQIADTVATPHDVDDEMRYLVELLR